MSDEHLYIVTYDISDARRWRAIFRLMNGYGDWLQLSVFQCRLTKARLIELQASIAATIHNGEDHVILVDVGPAETVKPRVISLGKRAFAPVQREAVVV